jgi:hypothetical protein
MRFFSGCGAKRQEFVSRDFQARRAASGFPVDFAIRT